jgi:serine protease Do
MAEAIKDQLIKTGGVVRGYLGVVIQDLTQDLANSFGLENQKGVLVSQVAEDSPAEKAGFAQGDVIVEFDGKPVENAGPFRNDVALRAPGTKAEVTVLRNGKRKTLTVTIGTLPDSEIAEAGVSKRLEAMGLAVESITPELYRQFDLQDRKGVVVTAVKPGSAAAMAGINPGAVILEVNRKSVDDAAAFEKAVAATPENSAVLLLIKDGQYTRYVALAAD